MTKEIFKYLTWRAAIEFIDYNLSHSHLCILNRHIFYLHVEKAGGITSS